jgi:hypothetical protein
LVLLLIRINYYGVPLIVIPQSVDQPIIAGQVANIGVGLKLQMQDLSANQLREAVYHVLNQKLLQILGHPFKNRVGIIKLLMRFSNL